MENVVGFVILHYGDIEVTKRCIESIDKLEYKDKQIVLVDNDINKSDIQRDKLDSEFKKYNYIHILRMDGDYGFSKPNNIGVEYIRDKFNPKYIIVCNNDVEFPQKEFINLVDDIFKETNFAVLGPDIIKKVDDTHQNPLDTKIKSLNEAKIVIFLYEIFLKAYDLFYPIAKLYFDKKNNEEIEKRKNENYENKRQENIVLMGACLIFSEIYFKKRDKCFDPETHFYYEEYILAYQCRKNDLKLVYNPDIYVYHEASVATNTVYKNQKRKRRFLMSETLKSAYIYKRMIESDTNEYK